MTQPHPIYLDHNATTPLDPCVLEAMLPYLAEQHGNPSSGHAWGRRARTAVATAREQAAVLLGASPAEIVFTSGGTEANNQAILGVAARHLTGDAEPGHIVTSAVEHPAVSEVCRHLATRGYAITTLPVDKGGRIAAAAVPSALRADTRLVTVMLANNEVGAVQPVAAVARLARARGVPVHTDAAQAVGKIAVDVDELGIDLLSVAGHKLYAPKGVGLLYVRAGLDLPNLMHGAAHEGGRRPGTENVASIVGLGRACELVASDLTSEGTRLAELRDQLQSELLARFPMAKVHGQGGERLPNTLSIGFPGATADAIMAAMPDVAVSAGAACHAEGVTVSHVLRAMDVPEDHARGSLRISLGRGTDPDTVARGLAGLIRAVTMATSHGPGGPVSPASS